MQPLLFFIGVLLKIVYHNIQYIYMYVLFSSSIWTCQYISVKNLNGPIQSCRGFRFPNILFTKKEKIDKKTLKYFKIWGIFLYLGKKLFEPNLDWEIYGSFIWFHDTQTLPNKVPNFKLLAKNWSVIKLVCFRLNYLKKKS